MAVSFDGFSLGLLHFLNDLANNNNKDWFNDQKQDYEDFLAHHSIRWNLAYAEGFEAMTCAVIRG